MSTSNNERAERGHDIRRNFERVYANHDDIDNLIDALTDMLHAGNVTADDIRTCLERAERNFEVECANSLLDEYAKGA